jgi:putative flippase GtrA
MSMLFLRAHGDKIMKFICVGVAGLLLNLGITYVLTERLRLWYFTSFLIATFFTWTFIFLMNSVFTFAGHSKNRYFKRYVTFMLGYASLFWVNALLVLISTSFLHVLYLISIIFATIITAIFTFLFNERYVYRD